MESEEPAHNLDNGRISIVRQDCMVGLRSIDDESVDAIVTDPPYGIEFQSSMRKKAERFEKIKNDERAFIWWLYDAFRVLKEDRGLICFSRYDKQQTFINAMGLAGFSVKNVIVWDKMTHGMGDLRKTFAPRYETAIYATKGDVDLIDIGGRRFDDLVAFPQIASGKMTHPNEKPVEIYEHFVRCITRDDDLVLDPFMGSGTCAVACYRTHRRFRGYEVMDRYYDGAVSKVESLCQPQLFR